MRTPITYYGGKQMIAKRIVSLIPKHKIYCEPFFGGGAVFFKKPPSKLEVINDINDRLMTFYRVIQDDHESLFNAIKNTPHSESFHKLAREIYNKRTDYDKVGMAWAVWMMTNSSFTGSPHGSWRWCNGSAGSHVGRVLSKKRNELSEALYNRLRYVQISSREALRVIENRDTEDAFFYLDPPYPGANQKHYYGYKFKEYRELLETLSNLRGKFILSNYWSQTLRYYTERNGWFTDSIDGHIVVNHIKSRENIAKGKTEWLVMNFKPPKAPGEQQTMY